MELIINNKSISEPIENIIYDIKRVAQWNVFKEIYKTGKDLKVTCPFHSDGNEKNPSCYIYTDYSSDKILPGTIRCFSCGETTDLIGIVARVLYISRAEAKNWLADRYGSNIYTDDIYFPKWEDNKNSHTKNNKEGILSNSILNNYSFYHPYVGSRKISKSTAQYFNIGYNKNHNSITFPVWDERNNLVMIVERRIDKKQFYIPKGIEKPVYLLNYVLNLKRQGKDIPYIFVVEGPFDCLTAWEYGYPCVATLGSFSYHQVQVLKNCGINNFITLFDNDDAGKQFTLDFNSKIGKDKFILNAKIDVPNKKDLNDLSKEEFKNILINNKLITN